VEVLETHLSHVFLAGQFAYKLKKPVRYDFVDFTTRSARQFACTEEVRLNRRLAPDMYLGVCPITQQAGGQLAIEGGGRTVDWVVKMRRLPADLTLDRLLAEKTLKPEHVDQVANRMAQFYGSLTPLGIDGEKYRQRLLAHVQANSKELLAVEHRLARTVVQRVQAFQLQLLELHPEVFRERAAQGRIFDGHGDLRPEHICFTSPLTIFDCLEFNEDLRRIDALDELAFLASECDFLDAEWIGERLRTQYLARTNDPAHRSLWDFYKTYRSAVRAKVAALRADQLRGKDRSQAQSEAEKHLMLADGFCEKHERPLVIVVGGLPGTGKSTIAAALAQRLGAERLRTDEIRNEILGPGRGPERMDEGRYTPQARQRVYAALFERATELHRDGVSVVLDATFGEEANLRKALTITKSKRSIKLAIECTCPPETAHERIVQRLAARHDVSQAGLEQYREQRKRWETWPKEAPRCKVDTEQPLESQVESVLEKLRKLAVK
jgi:aminoglycoside phosphotransferase family enzyme/predicted kinase